MNQIKKKVNPDPSPPSLLGSEIVRMSALQTRILFEADLQVYMVVLSDLFAVFLHKKKRYD